MANLCYLRISAMLENDVEARMIYMAGASGSGKDSLMRYAREKLAGEGRVQFAHRYITRPADTCGENHIALSPEEFESRLVAGLFAMHWRSHGMNYGIGVEVLHWLGQGITVVINGSREYLPKAQSLYPELVPVIIDVSATLLKQRLLTRGRESEQEINARLARNEVLKAQPVQAEFIRNDGPLGVAGNQLVELIRRYSGTATCA
jgi:ribose 1,5-bisphosphokinase